MVNQCCYPSERFLHNCKATSAIGGVALSFWTLSLILVPIGTGITAVALPIFASFGAIFSWAMFLLSSNCCQQKFIYAKQSDLIPFPKNKFTNSLQISQTGEARRSTLTIVGQRDRERCQ